MQIKKRTNTYYQYQNQRSGCDLNSNSLVKDFDKYGLKIDKSWNILDIGCRKCHVLNRLWKGEYKNIYGVDIGELAEKSWEKIPYKSNLKRCDIHDGIPFDIKFNLITISHTLEHLYDPFKVRKIIFDSLSNNGLVHCIVPIEDEDDFIMNIPHLVRFKEHEEHIEFWKAGGFEVRYNTFGNNNSMIICQKI